MLMTNRIRLIFNSPEQKRWIGETSGCQTGNSYFLPNVLPIEDDSLPPLFPPWTVFTSLTQEAFNRCAAGEFLSFTYELPAPRNAAQEL